MRLKDRATIVTGSAQGIGKAYALRLAAEGARVVVTDILDCAPTVLDIEAKGGDAFAIQADVSDEASTVELAAKTVAHFGRIDVLINNAAVFAGLPYRPFDKIPIEEWDRVMAVNVRGPFLCCKAVVPYMKKQGKGKIINVASSTFFTGVPMLLHYVSSKGAVIAFTRALARELGEFNITVNALAPGYTLSEANLVKPRERADAIIRRRCLKRDEYPDDLCGTMVFLCCDDSDFVTGQTILVDGGEGFN